MFERVNQKKDELEIENRKKKLFNLHKWEFIKIKVSFKDLFQ